MNLSFKCLLSLFISSVCSRVDCNRVAHELASLGYDCVEGNELISSSIPEHIAVIVAADLSADK